MVQIEFLLVNLRELVFERVQGLSTVQAVILSPRRPGFDLRPLCVGFMVSRMALGRVVLPGASTSFSYSSFQLYYLISPVDRVAK